MRDYIHVSDLARAHVLALEALASGHPGGAYNLGCGGSGSSVKQVIDVAQRVCGREIPVRTGPRRPGDPAVLVASSGRIARELGWTPRLQDLREIVASAWSRSGARSCRADLAAWSQGLPSSSASAAALQASGTRIFSKSIASHC